MSNRFQTNTAEKPVDRRRMHGFAPGLRMSMSPRASNIPGWSVPQGQLIIFNPRVDGYLKDRMVTAVNKRGEKVKAFDASHEFSGRHFAEAVAAKFQLQKDFGFRVLECLYDLDYDPQTGWDEADEYFATLYPKIDCEMGLEKPNPIGASGDLINNGEPLPCPTCRLKWLEEKADEAIANSPLNKTKLFELKAALTSSFTAGHRFAQAALAKSVGEIESEGANRKKALDDADRQFMKMLHEKPSHVKQAEIQSEAARVQGEAMAAAMAPALAQVMGAKSDQDEIARLKAEIESLKQKEKK